MPLTLTLPPATLAQMQSPNAPAPTTTPGSRWPAWAAALGDAGDLITTQIAMAKGAHEANPLLPSGRLGNAVAQGLEDVLTQYLIHALGPHHPTIQKLLGAGVGGVGAYSTLRNIQTIRAQDLYNLSGGQR